MKFLKGLLILGAIIAAALFGGYYLSDKANEWLGGILPPITETEIVREYTSGAQNSGAITYNLEVI